MLRVHLFGAFALKQTVPVHVALGTTTRRLASYLFSFPNEMHRREKLLDILWSEADEAQARACLSNSLWRIRQALSSEGQSTLALRANSYDVCLELADTTVVDIHRFRSSIGKSFAADRRSFDLNLLEHATSLYTAPFLEEYDEDWVLDLRERLQSLYLRVLIHIMRTRAQQGCYEDALLYGRRILASDPMRESVQRAVMLLYVLNGQRVEAIRQFRRCTKALRSECDVDPMPETCGLYALIRSNDIFKKLPSLAEAEFGAAKDSTLANWQL
jgi:DNA-binding SARP family transcriptional activator